MIPNFISVYMWVRKVLSTNIYIFFFTLNRFLVRGGILVKDYLTFKLIIDIRWLKIINMTKCVPLLDVSQSIFKDELDLRGVEFN